jgi:hypothetical protein
MGNIAQTGPVPSKKRELTAVYRWVNGCRVLPLRQNGCSEVERFFPGAINPSFLRDPPGDYMFKIIILMCTVLSAPAVVGPVYADSSNSKDDAIKELLLVMKTSENMETSLTAMKDTIKMNSAHFHNEIMAILLEDLDAENLDKASEKYTTNDSGAERLYELFRYKFNLDRVEKEVMIPAYSDHYSESEIRGLIDFYTSDLGQKTLRVMPEISRSISSKTREISQMSLSQAQEELAHELKKSLQ